MYLFLISIIIIYLAADIYYRLRKIRQYMIFVELRINILYEILLKKRVVTRSEFDELTREKKTDPNWQKSLKEIYKLYPNLKLAEIVDEWANKKI